MKKPAMSKILLPFAVPFLFAARQSISSLYTFSIDSPLSHDIIAQSESILPIAGESLSSQVLISAVLIATYLSPLGPLCPSSYGYKG
jgi:hypothetical protein